MLNKQTAAISLRGGVDTKTDPKQVVSGRLLAAENVTFTSSGRLQKRNGFDALTRRISNPPGDAATVSTGQALMTYGGELLLADASSLYSYDASAPGWTYRGGFSSCRVTQAPVVRNTRGQNAQDGATHPNGMELFAWEDSQGADISYTVIDSATRQVVVPPTLISMPGIMPKVLVFGALFVIIWMNANDGTLNVSTLPAATPTAALTTTTIMDTSPDANAAVSESAFDATVFPVVSTVDAAGIGAGVPFSVAEDRMFLVFSNRAGGLSLWAFAPTDATNPIAKATVALPGGTAADAVTVFGDRFRGGPVIAWYANSQVMFRAYDADLVTTFGFGTAEVLDDVVTITGASTSADALSLRLFYSVAGADSWNDYTRIATIDGSYRVTAAGAGAGVYLEELAAAPADLLRSVSLAGKAFVYDGIAYVPLVYQSPLQPTAFVADETGRIVAKLLPGAAQRVARADAIMARPLPETTAIDATTFRLPLLARDQLTTVSGAVFTQTGVVAVDLDFFDAEHGYLRAELAQNLHVSGGFLAMYDGVSVVEHGFHLFPEPLGVTLGSGGGLSTGSYQWVACYEWTDNQGQIHRSAPSVPVTASATAGQKAGIEIPTLRLTAKQGVRTPVSLVVYRTAANGTVFYRVTSPTSPTENTTTGDTVGYFDTVTDADLIGNPLLYTRGVGDNQVEIENIAPPALGSLTVHRNRVVGVDTADPLTLWYSKEIVSGAPVEFTDSFSLDVDPRGGDVTAVASLDDKLVAFKASSIFYFTGQGPDPTGANNNFSDAQLVTTDCGCTAPRSVVTVPAGLMFQTAKGIYLLDRGLRVSYIGADVEAYNGDTVTSAVLISDTNQVRFTLDSGVALVFDYLSGQWSTFTPIRAVDSVIWQGVHAYLFANGTVRRETAGSFTDSGSFVKMRITSSWLQFANLAGFQRAYKALLLGEYRSPHRLLVSVAYDFNPAPAQVDEITPTAPGAYGDDSPYGSGTPYGGDFPLYLWRVFFARQKCTAFQLTIEDAQDGTPGESMSLSSISLEIGIKRGLAKMAAANSVG